MIQLLLLVVLVASGLAVHLYLNDKRRRERMAEIRWTFLAGYGNEPECAWAPTTSVLGTRCSSFGLALVSAARADLSNRVEGDVISVTP